MKRKDDNSCRCDPPPFTGGCRYRLCRYGHCAEYVCLRCDLFSWGYGPMLCKCDVPKPRLFLYPDMDVKPHVALKSSARRRRVRKW